MKIKFTHLKRKMVGKEILNDSELMMINNALRHQDYENNLIYLSMYFSYYDKTFKDVEATLNSLIVKGYLSINGSNINIFGEKLLKDINKRFPIKTKYESLRDKLSLKSLTTKDLNNLIGYRINLPESDIYKSGVYLIDDFYIGKSNNIGFRLETHINGIIPDIINGTNLTKPQLLMLYNMVNNNVINGEVISKVNSTEEENKMINTYLEKGFPLTNTTGVNIELKLSEEELIQKFVKKLLI